MTRIAVEATYHTGATGYAELPEDKTWNDVEDWFVKWDCLHVKFKGQEQWHELNLNSDDSDDSDGTDWKWPMQTAVYPCNEDGDILYGTELDSQED